MAAFLILLAGDHGSLQAEEYSAYSDPKKPAISVILSEKQNVDELEARFGLSERQVDEVLAATRRENRALAKEFAESERVLAANKDLPKEKIKKKIAASDYDERVAAAVSRTKGKIEAIVDGDQSASLEGWVDNQWEQEVRAASTEDPATESAGTYTASAYYENGLRCYVFATQYYGNTRREVALPHQKLKFGRQPRIHIRRGSGGPTEKPRVQETGPWNIHDNYWARWKNRTRFKRAGRCNPEAQEAYYHNFHRGRDEFGREVLNPAGIDVTPAVARGMNLKRYQNAWVYVRFPWVHR
ncbi:MAG TPA: hypothetical protein VKA20_07145 [Rubrobacter sp.]|nr:hypothetical protein [Rubrobacter sp.]